MPTRHVIIKGKVQGVFYRVSAKDAADKIGVTGWVKNMADGSVEAMVSGNASELDAFISWCARGPANAVVVSVTAEEKEETTFNGFQILRR